MLIFLTSARHDYTIKGFLETEASPLTGRVINLNFEEFLSWRQLPAGHYIFADVDRLKPDERLAVAARMAELQRLLPNARLLNHPLRSLGRQALLTALEAAGINRFRSRRATEDLSVLHYPLFVRTEVEHGGSLTPLLDDPASLDAALAELAARGVPLAECLVVEFVDVRNDEGLYEKYGMLRVGDALYGSDLCVNTGWICKGENDEYSSEAWVEKDLAFQRSSPHAELIRPIFELAGIDYGRIDYAFSNGALQVFEINSNPTIATVASLRADWKPAAEQHRQNFVAAMTPLLEPVGSQYYVRVPGAIGPDRVHAPTRFRYLLRVLLRRLRLLHQEPRIMRLRNRLRALAARN
ncbi:hypothetical protein [Nevskia sp.]|uniref:hypothetical protein n=1 Tax=Nevskia sp. TaxID=1929292 RepID=UPI0025DAD066|nr:hypothetical protein [Nevskia sp.]